MLNRETGLLKQHFNLALGNLFCPFSQLPSDKTLSAIDRRLLHLLANEWAQRAYVDSIRLLYPFNSFYVVQHPVFGTERCGRVVRGSNHLL
jgi:hypothetical protein